MVNGAVQLSPRVTRVRAPNPSPMTLSGTNSYLVDGGEGVGAVIDPGPAMPAHISALEAAAAAAGLAVRAIFVTHGHPDHAPGAALLRARTGAPVHAHPEAQFPHQVSLGDGETVRLANTALSTIDAPGHADDHLVFFLEDENALFTGDVVIGEGTVVIAPPRGDMRAYQHTLARLRADYAEAAVIYGGHGPEISAVRAKLDEYIEHRALRERQLLAVLAEHEATVPDLVRRIYAQVSPVVWPAAARQLIAYLNALQAEGAVQARALARAPTPAEAAILNPDLSRIAHAAQLDEVAAEELGVHMGHEPLRLYAISRSSK